MQSFSVIDFCRFAYEVCVNLNKVDMHCCQKKSGLTQALHQYLYHNFQNLAIYKFINAIYQ